MLRLCLVVGCWLFVVHALLSGGCCVMRVGSYVLFVVVGVLFVVW